MNIEKVIRLHNRFLENEVNDNVYLIQRIRVRLKDKNFKKKSALNLRFRKLVILYSLVFLFFIFINFKFLGWLNKEKTRETFLVTVNENPFQPVIPGSLSHAFLETFKWQE